MESVVLDALRDSGGQIRKESEMFYVDFDETVIGFWLDMAIALEGVAEAFQAARKELFGWSCVVRSGIDVHLGGPTLCRELSAKENPTGVWCDASVASSLLEYATFSLVGELYALNSFTFRNLDRRIAGRFIIRPRLVDALYSLHLSNPTGPKKAVAIEGSPFMGKRQSLRAAFEGISSSLKALRISFGERRRNVAVLADGVTEKCLQEIGLDDPAAESELRSRLGAVKIIKAGRHSYEIPAVPREAFGEYFSAFVDRWLQSAAKTKVPVFVVEDAQFADSFSRAMLRTLFGTLIAEGRAHIVITCTGDEAIRDLLPADPIIVRIGAPVRSEWEPLISEARKTFGLPEADTVLTDRCLAAASESGVSAGYRLAIGWNQAADGCPLAAHPHLTEDLLETAYVLALSLDLLDPNDWLNVFSSERKPRGALPLALAHLEELGILYDTEYPQLLVDRFSDFAEEALPERGHAVRRLIRKRIVEAVQKKQLANSYETATILVGLGGSVDDDSILDAIVDGVLRGETQAVEKALADYSFSGVVGKERAAALAGTFSARKALVFGDDSEINAVFSLPPPEEFPNPRYQAYTLLDRAAFLLSSGSSDAPILVQAAQSAKNALLLLQRNRTNKGLPRAYRLLGETELARERINEAIDYFGFAAESSESSDEQYEAMLSSVNGTCTQFLLGNLSSALRHAQKAEERADRLYLREWFLWARFMQGRIRFEIGDYDQAAAIFDVLAVSGKAVPLFRNWRDRSLVHGNPEKGVFFVDESGDAAFFRLEAAFLLDDFEQTIIKAEEYLTLPEQGLSTNPERVDWCSGFSLVENRAIGRNGTDRVCRRVARTYRALALAKMGSGATASEELHRIAKEEPISGLDPYDSFYFFALSACLRMEGAQPVDWHTVMSIAFKRLQRRASRIDDAELRRSYLAGNRWNRILFAEAKAINLI